MGPSEEFDSHPYCCKQYRQLTIHTATVKKFFYCPGHCCWRGYPRWYKQITKKSSTPRILLEDMSPKQMIILIIRLVLSLSARHKIWLYLLQRGYIPSKIGILAMRLHRNWGWGFTSDYLGSVEHCLIAITPISTLPRRGSTC